MILVYEGSCDWMSAGTTLSFAYSVRPAGTLENSLLIEIPSWMPVISIRRVFRFMQLANIKVMSVTLLKSKLLKSRSTTRVLLNMEYIFSTFVVQKDDTSILSSEVHPWNIICISVALSVWNPLRSRVFSFEHSRNR